MASKTLKIGNFVSIFALKGWISQLILSLLWLGVGASVECKIYVLDILNSSTPF